METTKHNAWHQSSDLFAERAWGRARLNITPKLKESHAGQRPHSSKNNLGLQTVQAYLPVGKRLKRVTGGLPTMPLWVEDKSAGLGNGDLKADLGITFYSGAICLV